MSNSTVVYVISGPGYLPYLITSLFSLRNVYDGRITVCAWPESFWYVKKIALDSRLSIEPVLCEPEYRGKNSQFLHKIKICNSLIQYDKLFYLDADTLVMQFPCELLDCCDEFDLVATCFCNWTTNNSIMRRRISWLLQVGDIPSQLVSRAMNEPYKSPNGGVFVCRPNNGTLSKWYEWTFVAKRKFIADELILQILQIDNPKMFVAGDGRFNCSMSRLQPSHLMDTDVMVWHGHGNSFGRPEKSYRAHMAWKNLFLRCIENNIGCVTEWWSECFDYNKYLKRAKEGIKILIS